MSDNEEFPEMKKNFKKIYLDSEVNSSDNEKGVNPFSSQYLNDSNISENSGINPFSSRFENKNTYDYVNPFSSNYVKNTDIIGINPFSSGYKKTIKLSSDEYGPFDPNKKNLENTLIKKDDEIDVNEISNRENIEIIIGEKINILELNNNIDPIEEEEKLKNKAFKLKEKQKIFVKPEDTFNNLYDVEIKSNSFKNIDTKPDEIEQKKLKLRFHDWFKCCKICNEINENIYKKNETYKHDKDDDLLRRYTDSYKKLMEKYPRENEDEKSTKSEKKSKIFINFLKSKKLDYNNYLNNNNKKDENYLYNYHINNNEIKNTTKLRSNSTDRKNFTHRFIKDFPNKFDKTIREKEKDLIERELEKSKLEQNKFRPLNESNGYTFMPKEKYLLSNRYTSLKKNDANKKNLFFNYDNLKLKNFKERNDDNLFSKNDKTGNNFLNEKYNILNSMEFRNSDTSNSMSKKEVDSRHKRPININTADPYTNNTFSDNYLISRTQKNPFNNFGSCSNYTYSIESFKRNLKDK